MRGIADPGNTQLQDRPGQWSPPGTRAIRFEDQRSGGGDEQDRNYDVIVVGSGAAGATAALRCAALGLSVLIIEKAHKYGGTSAASGGVMWIPNHCLTRNDDSREQSLLYLQSLVRGPIQRERLEAFVDQGAEMIAILEVARYCGHGGAVAGLLSRRAGRALRSFHRVSDLFDGREFGDQFTLDAGAVHPIQIAQPLLHGSAGILCHFFTRARVGFSPSSKFCGATGPISAPGALPGATGGSPRARR